MLSIIIPAYNAGPYIESCLKSILPVTRQGHEVEIIVVNDGSTDNTLQQIETFRDNYFAEQKHHFTIISQSNAGLSAARNAGISKASGRYICFVDADDQLLPDAQMPWQEMNDARQFDIISIEMMQQGRPYRRYVPHYGKPYTPAREFLKGRNLMPCAVAYIIRREFLISEGISFCKGIYHEDEDFSLRLFLAARSFIATPHRVYDYILHPESITTTANPSKQQQKLRDIITILQTFSQHPEAAYAQYKLHYLTVDLLRLLLRQHHPHAFEQEIISHLRHLHLFPLPWHWEWKYILFRTYCLLRFWGQ